MIDLTHTMPAGDVARALGVSMTRVRQLDDQLRPVRISNGARRYDPRMVEQLIAKRSAR